MTSNFSFVLFFIVKDDGGNGCVEMSKKWLTGDARVGDDSEVEVVDVEEI